jgi:UDP-glucose 4-epimerase
MTILVTGGAGFIGSHLVCRLLSEGHRVRVLDSLASGKESNLSPVLDRVEWVPGDLRDEAAVAAAVKDVELVFHEGALPSVPKSFESPWLFNEVNIGGTLRLLLAARDAKVRRVVQASSSSVYGDTEVLPKVETLAPRPKSPYALTKLVAEMYGRIFHTHFGLEVVSLRYFNVFGPRQSLRSGYAAVIPSFITAALQSKPLLVEGDGEQTRDFCYIDDVVDANLLAMAAPTAAGEALNIAGNNRASVNEVADMLKRLMPGKTLEVKYGPPRPGDIRNSWADITKAQNVLGYRPKVTLEEGLRRTIRYFEAQLG